MAFVGSPAPDGGNALFDNRFGNAEAIGDEMQVTQERATAPSALHADAEFVMATIRGQHPDHPGWRQPVQDVEDPHELMV